MLEHLDPDRPFVATAEARQAVAHRIVAARRRRQGARVAATGSVVLAAALVGLALVDTGSGSQQVALRGAGAEPTTTLALPAATAAAGLTTTVTTGPASGGSGQGAGSSTTVPAAGPPVRATSMSGNLWIEAVAEPGQLAPGELFRLTVQVRDSDGVLTSFRVRFGDGDGVGFAADLACPPTTQSDQAGPSETRRTLDYEHAYRQPGRYEVVVDAETFSCTAPVERVQVTVPVAVVGATSPSNGPRPPVARFSPAGSSVDPATGTVLSAATGADDDGYVSVIEVDWGDGRGTEVAHFDLGECRDTAQQWPTSTQALQHRYGPGTYRYRVVVTSVGCDGRDAQQATAEGTVQVLSAPAPHPS